VAVGAADALCEAVGAVDTSLEAARAAQAAAAV
jgi:hypothetical protein